MKPNKMNMRTMGESERARAHEAIFHFIWPVVLTFRLIYFPLRIAHFSVSFLFYAQCTIRHILASSSRLFSFTCLPFFILLLRWPNLFVCIAFAIVRLAFFPFGFWFRSFKCTLCTVCPFTWAVMMIAYKTISVPLQWTSWTSTHFVSSSFFGFCFVCVFFFVAWLAQIFNISALVLLSFLPINFVVVAIRPLSCSSFASILNFFIQFGRFATCSKSTNSLYLHVFPSRPSQYLLYLIYKEWKNKCIVWPAQTTPNPW